MFAVGLSYMAFTLLSKGSFYAHFLKSFHHKWVLNFVKGFFCIYWDYHMVFIFEFVNVVYHIDWLGPWNKPNLFMVYELFDVLLNSVCQNFVEDFCIYGNQWYWPVVFFFCIVFVWFWCKGDGGLVEWVWKCSSAIFGKNFRRIGISSPVHVEWLMSSVPSESPTQPLDSVF